MAQFDSLRHGGQSDAIFVDPESQALIIIAALPTDPIKVTGE
jgi:hypothetical protein